ncbi:formin-like protein 7 [Drosophila erecta]|uniref:Uncharacterized protein n=1 Tax=Drosophila erecta TaxID=7220 RepID=B3NUR2_DROER|nr:formin-like protein 7 [Drosophila erecta]EDV46659.2 uncharacterized protein Dere_GG19206 [Drosophila erecta]
MNAPSKSDEMRATGRAISVETAMAMAVAVDSSGHMPQPAQVLLGRATQSKMSQEPKKTPVTGMDGVAEGTVAAMDEIAQKMDTFEDTLAPKTEVFQQLNTASHLAGVSQTKLNPSNELPQIFRAAEKDAYTAENTNVNVLQKAPTSVVMVEQPNTIIELVDLYVPPASVAASNGILLNSRISRPFFPIPVAQHPESQGESTPKPATKGRRRGPKPGPPKPRPAKRRRAETPPPLPPPPNFLAHCINPLENEIYPKVIVQPAHQPWVLRKDLHDGAPKPRPPLPPPPPPPPPAPKPALKVEVKEVVIPISGALNTPTTQSQPLVVSAHIREKLQLFGPDVTISLVNNQVSSYFKAVRQEADGHQRQLIFTAAQLLSFSAAQYGNWHQMVPIQMLMMKPSPAMLSHYFPGPMGQILVNKLFPNQQALFQPPPLPFKPPTVRPPQPKKRAPRPNQTYLHPGRPPVAKHLAPPAPAAAAPARSVTPTPTTTAASSPPKSPEQSAPLITVPSILRRESQVKLRLALEARRAKVRKEAEEAAAAKLNLKKAKEKDESKDVKDLDN